MLCNIHVRVVGVESLFTQLSLDLPSSICEGDHEKPDKESENASPDDFDVPWEWLCELSLWALNDCENFDGGSVETEPGKRAQSVAVVIWDVLVPFLGCGQWANSPQSYAELKKIVLGWNPKYKL